MIKRKKRKTPSKRCKPPFRISEAGHLLSKKRSRKAGSTLSRDGKAAKRKRLQRGCLNGPAVTFKLSPVQMRVLARAVKKSIAPKRKKTR